MSSAGAVAAVHGLGRLGFIKLIRILKFANILDFIKMGEECYKKYHWVHTYADLMEQEFCHQNSARLLQEAEAAVDVYINSLSDNDRFPYDPNLADFQDFHDTPEDRHHFQYLQSLMDPQQNPQFYDPAKKKHKFRSLLPAGRRPYSAQR